MTEIERIISQGILSKEFFLPEIRDEFEVSTERKKLWGILIDLLLEFDRVCRKHGLRYYLMRGTLLGAVRHKGFIPWDDDMDVGMPRDDYEKLLLLQEEFKNPYFLQTPYTDGGFFYAHAKLRNSNTSAIDFPFKYAGFNMGCFIDILPLDKFPKENGKIVFEQICKLIMDNSTYMRIKNTELSEKDKIRVKEYTYRDPYEVYEEIQRLGRQFQDGSSKYVCLTTGVAYGFERDLFWEEDFRKIVLQDFEGFKFPIPKGYDRVLKIAYGNYWEFPPQNERGNWHGNVVFETDIPYKEYLEGMQWKVD